MKNKFPGFYHPSADDFDKMWQNGTFIFDTNVLLDLYRYSEETVKDLLSIIENLRTRIWIPYRVAFEYHRRINDIVKEQVKSYNEAVSTLDNFNKSFKKKKGHPFLDNELQLEIDNFCNKFKEKLQEKEDAIKGLLVDNPVKNKLSDLISTNIGEKFTDQELDAIYEEGEKRYTNRIPPGYKDKGSKPGNEIYGDLIIWKEILKKAKESDSPIIFVTGDVKEDWFQEIMGLTIGPRPELVEELKGVNDILFYIYPIDSFMKYANKLDEYEIKETTIKEISELIAETQLEKDNAASFETPIDGDYIDSKSEIENESSTQDESEDI